MAHSFNNRIFGSVILKSINSNFNADFTHHPRTLPDGTVYATDKALKYAIKDYLRKNTEGTKLFFVKRYNDNLNPLSLDETYKFHFGEYPKFEKKEKDNTRKIVLTNLLKCLDIRLFGATFAGETNISIHGVVQINHGVNKFVNSEIYTEDILSPFRNPGKENAEEKEMTTIGNQTNLQEGHYVYHFSVNPQNTKEFYKMISESNLDSEKDRLFESKDTSIPEHLSLEDIHNFKTSLNKCVTYLDSSRKIGTENEATVWVQLKENSKIVLPSFTELITIDNTRVIDLSLVETIISDINEEIDVIELYYNPKTTSIKGLQKGGKVKHFNILNDIEI